MIENPQQLMEYAERFGGWAVAIMVVRWLLMRMDRTISALQLAVTAFNDFANEVRTNHTSIQKSQDDILDELRRLNEKKP